MVGPLLALQFILLACYFGIILFLLIFTIWKRQALKKSIPSGILFLGLTAFTIYVYLRMQRIENKTSKKFLGDYKLNVLDRRKCQNCKVRLKENYNYDIIVNEKVVGQGKWKLETAIDMPGPFLQIDNGPSVVWETDRLIDYIDRIPNK